MIEIDPVYEMPLVSGMLIYADVRQAGRLVDLLAVYERLDPLVQKGAAILLAQRIALPAHFAGSLRGSRLNLFDAEIAMLLPYYHRWRAAEDG